MRRRTLETARLLAVAWCATAMLGGCSAFKRDWVAMAEAPTAPVGLEGRWDGTWLSHTNGHTGALRCIVDPDENGTLQARYHATYAGILNFKYTVPMTVRQEGDVFHFAAETDLGWLAGGRYEYEGTVVGDEFKSTYVSKNDVGIFEMTRVEPGRPEDGPDD